MNQAVLTIEDDPVTRSPTDISVTWSTNYDADAVARVPQHLQDRWQAAVAAISQGRGPIQPYGGLPDRVDPSRAATSATGIYAIGNEVSLSGVRWKVSPPYPTPIKFDPDKVIEDPTEMMGGPG